MFMCLTGEIQKYIKGKNVSPEKTNRQIHNSSWNILVNILPIKYQ